MWFLIQPWFSPKITSRVAYMHALLIWCFFVNFIVFCRMSSMCFFSLVISPCFHCKGFSTRRFTLTSIKSLNGSDGRFLYYQLLMVVDTRQGRPVNLLRIVYKFMGRPPLTPPVISDFSCQPNFEFRTALKKCSFKEISIQQPSVLMFDIGNLY